jgi:hypothetical protein
VLKTEEEAMERIKKLQKEGKMKTLMATLAIACMLNGTALAADDYFREGYDGTVLSTNLRSGRTTIFIPSYGGSYFGTHLD